MTRLLIICPDETGARMAGTAIRSVEIARALAGDIAVTVAVPDGSANVAGDMAQVRVPSESSLPPLVETADVVMVARRAELMAAVRKPLVVDLYDPFILSDLEFYGDKFARAGGRPLLALRWLQHHLANGDLFLCASAVQRSFWLGMLASAGRVNRANYVADHAFDELLAVVPFGISETPAVHGRAVAKSVIPGIGANDKLVLWAGGLWNWFDPIVLVHAMERLRAARPDVKALFLGMRHPNPAIGTMEMAERARGAARELGLEGRSVFFVDWVPYDERQNYLLEADVGVSLHQPGVEAQFAYRTRVLDYLWAGLPMVLSRGDDLAGLVERHELGTLVPEGDIDAVTAALLALIDTPADSARAERFGRVRTELAWSRVVDPLRRFCLAPRFAPDKREGGWFAPGTTGGEVLRKEDALIAEETLSRERELSPRLSADHSFSHDLVAAYDNLCRIDLLTWFGGPPPSADLVLSLYECDAAGRRVARVTVPLAEIAHNDWQRFEFRPVGNSRGRRYRWTLETTASETGLALWLCTPPEGGERVPASIVHYLVKGVADALPIDDEAFLFLHNATLTESLVPGLGGALDTTPALGANLAAENGRTMPATTTERALVSDATPAADAPSVTTDRDARLPMELARVGAEVAVLRHDLDRARGRIAELDDALLRAETAPVAGRLARDVLAFFRFLLGLARRLAGTILVAVVVVLGVPFAVIVALALAATDLRVALRRRSRATPDGDARAPAVAGDDALRPAALATTDGSPAAGPRLTQPVSVVIPTWNGQPLLEMSLPPLRAALAAHPPGGEIVVVDNGSDDDTRAYVAAAFPEVRVIALARNEGFAGAANRGVAEARHATVILLNNDMVVEREFIAPLLETLDEQPAAFGVSCHIDFIDKSKPRWETGKVHARFHYGTITLFHLDRYDEHLQYPIFYAGGGASAYDRAKFLALGGFDEAVFSPVYIEDVDLGYRAWKRGWPSLFEPRSIVHHKHRSTTRRLWSETTIHSFFEKNLAALVWKNVSDWRILLPHLAGIVVLPARVFRYMGGVAALATWRGLVRQLPTVLRARAREGMAPRRLDDATIFLVSRYRYAYRGVFGLRVRRAPDTKPRLLVVSPYSPWPAVHGGAVRMLALLRRLRPHVDVTLLAYGDTAAELDPESASELRRVCREVKIIERPGHTFGGMLHPHKTHGFWSESMREAVEYFCDREDYDLVQVEYTHMAHFLPPRAPGLVRVLVEHDVSFVSLARSRDTAPDVWTRLGVALEWMRMLRYEVAAVERADLVITMSDHDRAMLGRYVDTRHVVTIPNGVDCERFAFAADGREPASILFVGFFRHEPNVEAVRYFCREVLPLVRRARAATRFRIVGAYPPEIVRRLADTEGVEVTGQVDDIAPYYRRAAVFVAPVLQGSGTRLKILEAMASGCPVVSTTIGAEGLGAIDGRELLLADTPAAMAAAIERVLADAELARSLARAARALVVARYDWDAITERQVACYRDALVAAAADKAVTRSSATWLPVDGGERSADAWQGR
ncbi:MAG: glycosyltransferase [Deltaproteobacteria bacterium]|nr:MAG: glycosyltransferase [Deltaproteobacteria bacterium]